MLASMLKKVLLEKQMVAKVAYEPDRIVVYARNGSGIGVFTQLDELTQLEKQYLLVKFTAKKKKLIFETLEPFPVESATEATQNHVLAAFVEVARRVKK